MLNRADDHQDLEEMISRWPDEPKNVKSAFIRLKNRFLSKKNSSLSFVSRPGISYSVRATVINSTRKGRNLFALMDVVEDKAEGRWLSVCFYSDMITDPDEEGNLVPKGILGEDGYCFDLTEYEEDLIKYIEQRVDEAYANIPASWRADPGKDLLI